MHPEKLIDCLRQCSSNPVERMDEPSGYTPSPSIFPVIELQEVCYTYQSDTGVAPPALDGVTLSIDSGSFIALVGPNGSGKSTLMQHLNGLLMPDSGNVLIDGLDLTTKDTDLKSIRQQVGLIFQFPEAQLFEETVYDDVAFGPRNLGISEDEVKDRVGRALEQVRIDPDVFASRVPFTLSGGEKRRVAIAGILAMHPRFLVLDEPTAGLDAEGIHQIEDILLRFQETGGTTILVSHDMDLVARLAERVVVLDCGRIIADESPYTLFLKKDLLSSIRLQPPGLTYILSGLVDAGYSVNPAIFEIDVAADGIADCLGIE
jgi:energy-coupling factor transport system ATP-binding protein